MPSKKYLKYLIVALFTYFAFVSNASAFFCDFTELSRQKTISSHISTVLDYRFSEDGELMMHVELYNMQDNFRIDLNNQTLDFSQLRQNDFDGYIIPVEEGEQYRFDVHLLDDISCQNNHLRTFFVTVPTHNPFHNIEVCSVHHRFEQCGLWFQHNMSESQFERMILDRATTTTIIEPVYEHSTFMDLLADNYLYVLGGIGFAFIIVGIYVYRSRKDDFDLRT